MKSSIKSQVDSTSLETISPKRSISVDMIIALAVFLSCCLISFTESKEVAQSLLSNIMP